MATKYSLAFWQEHIKLFKKSGLTQTEYCRQNQIDPSYFSKYRRGIVKASKSDSVVNTFVEIKNKPITITKSSTFSLTVNKKYTIVTATITAPYSGIRYGFIFSLSTLNGSSFS